MSYFIADANGYVGDLATNTGLNALSEYLMKSKTRPLVKFANEGCALVEDLKPAIEGYTISDKEVNETLENLKSLVDKCDEIVIISNGVSDEDAEEEVEKLEKRAKIQRINRNRQKIKTYRTLLKKVLQGAFEDVKKQAKKINFSKLEKLAPDIKGKVAKALVDLDLNGFTIIMDDIDEILEEITRNGVFEALYQVGMSEEDLTDKMSELAVKWAREHSAELVGKKWVKGKLIDNPNLEYAITDSTREMLRADVARAIEEGWSSERFAEVLEENYAFSEERAMAISRTELAFADVAGNMIAYKESGVVEGKEWILGSEHDDVVPDGDD